MPMTRELLVARGWVQAVLLVVLFGFLVLGILAWQTYAGEPPILLASFLGDADRRATSQPG
jgi:hypothetical protein